MPRFAPPVHRRSDDGSLPRESFEFYAVQDALYLREFARPLAVAAARAPTTLAYTDYLLAVAYGRPFHEALAALLPCYWIYWEVGKALTRAGSPNPLYARWIGTYGSDEFGSIVPAVLDATRIRRCRWTASSVCPLRPASASRATRRCWHSDGWSCREAER